MARDRDPGRENIPAIQKLRIQHAKRDRLRFTSHRDFQRAFERALIRAGVPMAYSAGFSPHPKISYANAAPTGVASEAEYVEIGVVALVDPEKLKVVLDEVLPPGLDILDVVEARTPDFVARLEASHWKIELPGTSQATLDHALKLFLDAPEVLVERMSKSGIRTFDARTAVIRANVEMGSDCAILQVVVRHGLPTVRPDDVLAALKKVADFAQEIPPRVTRLAQGPLLEDGWSVGDPFTLDREATQA